MLVYSVILFLTAMMLIGVGIAISKGKTDLIHEYHQTNVTDKTAYGKAFGRALLVIAMILLLSGIIGLWEDLAVLSVVVLFVGLCIGMGCIAAVQKKYNKGIF